MARSVNRRRLTRMPCRSRARAWTRPPARSVRRSATEVTVTITQPGLALLDRAAARHLALVDQLFWAPLTPSQRLTLGRLSQRLIDADSAKC